MDKKCPKCGSTKTQLSNKKSKHGILWLILFGWIWVCWWLFKATIALMVLMFFDWWWAIIKKSQNKGYTWLSKRMIQNSSKTYYCHECGHNFKA